MFDAWHRVGRARRGRGVLDGIMIVVGEQGEIDVMALALAVSRRPGRRAECRDNLAFNLVRMKTCRFLKSKICMSRSRTRKSSMASTLSVEKGQVAAIMGPNGSGKSTLAYVLAGKDNYKVTEGDVLLNGENILELAPDERAAKGVFLAFQYPVEVPGRRHDDLPAHRAQRAAQDARRGGIVDAGIHEARARYRRSISASARKCCAVRSMSDFPAARRSATRSCRWRS